jgi:molybdopterin synthase catalytic subunit
MFRISKDPIQPDDLYRDVLRDCNGAVVTFCGVVRDNSRGRRTDYLVYDAYEEMAERKMAEIGAEVQERWKIRDIAMLHRVGRLEIGEISVLIAVASPHRAQAFEACHYAIDRLKAVVPIWKKEVGQDGSSWVEGPKAATERI